MKEGIMASQVILNDKMVAYLEHLAKEGINNAAKGFSGMLGKELTVSEPEVCMLPLMNLSSIVGGPEDEAVGIYLRGEGDLATQFMMVIPIHKAVELVDLLMDEPLGTTVSLGPLERSALAEVGNLTATFFMNSIAAISGISLRPTPPAVMVDMVAAILDIVVATSGGISDSVMLLKTRFSLGEREVGTDFWVIPDDKTLRLLASRI
jgi:chemotaxis protein CheC